jgi:hypothetical protein
MVSYQLTMNGVGDRFPALFYMIASDFFEAPFRVLPDTVLVPCPPRNKKPARLQPGWFLRSCDLYR